MNGVELRNNFFDKKDLNEINKTIKILIDTKQKVDPGAVNREVFLKNFQDFYLDKNLGRIRINLKAKDLPPSAVHKLYTEATKINPNLEVGIISFVRYEKKYGYVQLVPHFDKPSQVALLFDIQLNSSVTWPLVVAEHEEYNMEDNDALILDATRKIHWRKPQVFNDNDFIDMLFVTFNDPNVDPASIVNQDLKVKEYYEEYKKYADSIYPASMQKCYNRILKLW